MPAALLERYAEGLANRANPATRSPGRPQPTAPIDGGVASIALALHETRPWIFDRLDPRTQKRVVAWLASFPSKRTWQNTWATG